MNTLHITYEGEISNYDTAPIKAAVLGGLLENISDEKVNIINASVIASRRGISVVEHKESVCKNYASLLTVETRTTAGTVTAAATVLRDETHIVRVNDYWMDIVPTGGYFLFADVAGLGFDDDLEAGRYLVREAGVAAVPGSSFYDQKSLGRTKLRFAFCKNEETLREAARRLMLVHTR